MNSNDQIRYYQIRLIKLMNELEKLTGKMMHMFAPELENEIWDAHDKKDKKRMMILNKVMCETIDKLKK